MSLFSAFLTSLEFIEFNAQRPSTLKVEEIKVVSEF